MAPSASRNTASKDADPDPPKRTRAPGRSPSKSKDKSKEGGTTKKAASDGAGATSTQAGSGERSGARKAAAKTSSKKKTTSKQAQGSGNGAGSGGRAADGGRIIPDTSVIVNGRITLLIQEGDLAGAEILVPEAAVAELEAQANRGLDSGYTGLDELVDLQRLAAEGTIRLSFIGDRPGAEEIAEARDGAIDAMIRELARETPDARLLTGDKVQAQVAEAQGIPYRYVRALAEDGSGFEQLEVLRYFDEDVMSVHLKQDVIPYVKAGTPGEREIRKVGTQRLAKRDLNRIARECVECARRDDQSFIEIERLGATVVQLRDMRIAISRPPFSESIEITAVRPVTHLSIEDYDLPDDVRERLSDHSRGVFVSGPPGSGKSTFAQAIGAYLHDQGTIVKTMESPRDLVLPDEVTQYAPLERDIELTGDFLLLVRPDFVIYDEVRKTRDFEVFADMRLAGVGLIGVTHANRAIDAIQRLIGRVELGMIPQVVDTVVHIINGTIQQILEMDFTVRVPAGMTEADLARPVIRVRDFQTKEELFEIYTYGEQVVVMPLAQAAGEGGGGKPSVIERMAKGQIMQQLDRYIRGPYDVRVGPGDAVTLYVQDWAIAGVIGKQGSNVKNIERRTGLKVNVKTFDELERAEGPAKPSLPERDAPSAPSRAIRKPGRGPPRPPMAGRGRDDEDEEDDEFPDARPGSYDPFSGGDGETLLPVVRSVKKNVILAAGEEHGGDQVEVLVDGDSVMDGVLSRKGEIRISRGSHEGRRVLAAHKRGEPIELRLV